MPKYGFNKVAMQVYLNHTSAWVFSCKVLYIFRTPFYKNTSGGLLLIVGIRNFPYTFETRQRSLISAFFNLHDSILCIFK